MKIPYERVFVDFGWDYVPIKLTGKCKSIKGGPNPSEFVEVQRYFFGFPIWKSWVLKSDIFYFEEEKTVIYDCKCDENESN